MATIAVEKCNKILSVANGLKTRHHSMLQSPTKFGYSRDRQLLHLLSVVLSLVIVTRLRSAGVGSCYRCCGATNLTINYCETRRADVAIETTTSLHVQ